MGSSFAIESIAMKALVMHLSRGTKQQETFSPSEKENE